jgi:hypothetical protein
MSIKYNARVTTIPGDLSKALKEKADTLGTYKSYITRTGIQKIFELSKDPEAFQTLRYDYLAYLQELKTAKHLKATEVSEVFYLTNVQSKQLQALALRHNIPQHYLFYRAVLLTVRDADTSWISNPDGEDAPLKQPKRVVDKHLSQIGESLLANPQDSALFREDLPKIEQHIKLFSPLITDAYKSAVKAFLCFMYVNFRGKKQIQVYFTTASVTLEVMFLNRTMRFILEDGDSAKWWQLQCFKYVHTTQDIPQLVDEFRHRVEKSSDIYPFRLWLTEKA